MTGANEYLSKIFAQLSGEQIQGGCDICDAYQTTEIDEHGIFHVHVHHDVSCPVLGEAAN